MLAAGLLAKNAVERGLKVKPWVKTSLSPGSLVVADYLKSTGLQEPLDALGFHLTGFGCMTCMGNRSEEHTSELQSLMRISYAVFCLKKKTKKQPNKPVTLLELTEENTRSTTSNK